MKTTWLWSPPQDEAFEKLKKELLQPTVLVLYDLNAVLKIPADISRYSYKRQTSPLSGNQRLLHLVHSAIRCRDTPRFALATMRECETFSDCVLSKTVLLETDHKSLVPLFTIIQLDRMSPQVLRFQTTADKI